MANDTLSYFF